MSEETIEIVSRGDREAEIRIGDRTVIVPYVISGSRVSFWLDGEIYIVDLPEKGARPRARHRDHSLEAPMPGLILKILVKQGDVVSKGAPLVVLEAMKMEHQITAPKDGRVTKVNCAEGELVQPGVDLVILSREDGEGSPTDMR